MEDTALASILFVFAATDPAGKRSYVESAGANVAAARYRLEIQGYTEIDVMKDDFDAKIDQAVASDAFDDMTLHEKMEFERGASGPDADRFVAWQFIKSEALTIVLLGAWVWSRAQGRTPWNGWSLTAYAFALGYVALLLRLRIPADLYERLNEARVWHRWDGVEATVKKIRRWEWLTGKLIPTFELLFSEARAQAGRGDLPGALERVRPLEADPNFNRALYYGLLTSLYEIAHDVPGSIAIAEKALALDPKSLTARVDLAGLLAQHARNPKRARDILAEVDPADVKPMVQPYLDLIHGVIALDERRVEEAEKLLGTAIEGWYPFTGNPLSKGQARILQGYHAVALRRLGRAEEAEETFAEVRPFLEATEDQSVLRRWSEA